MLYNTHQVDFRKFEWVNFHTSILTSEEEKIRRQNERKREKRKRLPLLTLLGKNLG